MEEAKVVALKVARDTIETGVEGIGGAVQMGVVEQNAVRIVEAADLRGLHDAVDLWETRCAGLLLGGALPPSASETPDRGVRPPDEVEPTAEPL